MKIVVMLHQCCRAVLTHSQGPFSSSCCPASEGLGMHQELGGNTARKVGPEEQGNVLYYATVGSEVKRGEDDWGRHHTQQLAKYQSAGGKQPPFCHSLNLCHPPSYYFFFLFSFLLSCYTFIFLSVPPPSSWGE